MKNKFFNRRGGLSYFSTPRIHGNVLAWLKPASGSERNKSVTKNLLRWEDDGGLIIEVAKPIMSLRFDQTIFKNEEVKRLSTSPNICAADKSVLFTKHERKGETQ